MRILTYLLIVIGLLVMMVVVIVFVLKVIVKFNFYVRPWETYIMKLEAFVQLMLEVPKSVRIMANILYVLNQ